MRRHTAQSGICSRASVTRPLRVFGPSQGNCQPSDLFSFAQVGAAVDDEAAVLLGLDIRVVEAVEVVEVADDLFEDVLQRDDADHLAIFVDHHADTALLLLEVHQLGRQRRAFRHEIRLHAGLAEILLGQAALGQQARDLAHVHDPFDLVDVVAVDRQAGVAGGAQLLDDDLEFVVEVDAFDFVARDHQVVDRDLLQVQQAEQHVMPVDLAGLGVVGRMQGLFVAAASAVVLFRRGDAEQAQQRVAQQGQ